MSMKQVNRLAVRSGLVEVIERTTSRGMHTDFCRKLGSDITGFLDKLKDEGIIPQNKDTSVQVLPSEQMEEALQKGVERETWQDMYEENLTAEDDQPPGDYVCKNCGHESTYEAYATKAGAISCPLCGHKMEFDRGIDFNAYWDVTDVINFRIEFEDDELDEIMEEARDITKNKLEQLNADVEFALSDLEAEQILRSVLVDHYKHEKLNIPQLWDILLNTILNIDHADNSFKTKGWVLALAKAYGVIDDFNFDTSETDDGRIALGDIGIDIIAADNPDYSGIDYDSSKQAAAVGYLTGLEVAERIVRAMENNGLMDRDSHNRYLLTAKKVRDKCYTMPERIAEVAAHYNNPYDKLKNNDMKQVSRVIDRELEHID